MTPNKEHHGRHALFCARHIEPLVPVNDRPGFLARLEEAERVLADGGRPSSRLPPSRNLSPYVAVAQWALKATRAAVMNMDNVSHYVREAEQGVEAVLRMHADADAAVNAFKEALAHHWHRVGALLIVRQYAPVRLDVSDIAFAGGTSEGAVIIVRVRQGTATHALVLKEKGRYCWREGSRDEILATVPDEVFEAAVSAVASETSS